MVNVSAGSRVVDDLVGEGLGVSDDEGRLVPASGPTRLVCLVRGDGVRRAGVVTHVVASGVLAPSSVTIHALGLLDGLAAWPCPSVSVEWGQARFSEWVTDASGVKYGKPRVLAQLPFATRADGYTVDGPALSTIRGLVQDSFDAVNALYGWSGNPHAVVEWPDSPDVSPRVLVRVNDDPVLATVAEPARAAGVGFRVRVWWPGDEPVRMRSVRDPARFEARSWSHPVQVFSVDLSEEA